MPKLLISLGERKGNVAGVLASAVEANSQGKEKKISERDGCVSTDVSGMLLGGINGVRCAEHVGRAVPPGLPALLPAPLKRIAEGRPSEQPRRIILRDA